MQAAFALFLLALLQAVSAVPITQEAWLNEDCSGNALSSVEIEGSPYCEAAANGKSAIYECSGVKNYESVDCTGTFTAETTNTCNGACAFGICAASKFTCVAEGAASSVEVGVVQGVALLGAGALLFNQ
jgi:hypothetical protein